MISAVKKRHFNCQKEADGLGLCAVPQTFSKKGLTFWMKSCIISLVAAKVVNIAG